MNTKVGYFLVIFYIISFITIGCNEELYDLENQDKAFTYIKKSYSDGIYDKTIEYARQFKTRYPYSQANMEIDLIIADSYFELQEYIEAATFYRRFVKLYPTHPKRAYALYQVGDSHWQQAPTAIDREQSFTQSAVKEWKELVKLYPDSQYSAKALILLKEGELRLFKSQRFIASFYCKQHIWHACAYRSLKLVNDYPKMLAAKKEALESAARAFGYLADQSGKDQEDSDSNVYFRDLSSDELKQKAEYLYKEAKKMKK